MILKSVSTFPAEYLIPYPYKIIKATEYKEK
jgi:hypothetical protein